MSGVDGPSSNYLVSTHSLPSSTYSVKPGVFKALDTSNDSLMRSKPTPRARSNASLKREEKMSREIVIKMVMMMSKLCQFVKGTGHIG